MHLSLDRAGRQVVATYQVSTSYRGASKFSLYLLGRLLHLLGLLLDPFQGHDSPGHRVSRSYPGDPCVGEIGGNLRWIELADILNFLRAQRVLPLLSLLGGL